MNQKNKDRLINYTTRLAVLVQGCSSANCAFRTDAKNAVGTANVCQCDIQADSLIDAIKAHVPSVTRPR